MRKILLLLLLSPVFFSCNSKKDDGFKITGKIKNVEKGGFISLYEFTETSFKGIDSVKVNDDGTYELKGHIAEPGFYRLNIFNKQPIVIVLENKEIVVDAEGTGPEGASEIKGSKATDNFIVINKIADSFQQDLKKLQTSMMLTEEVDTLKFQQDYENLRNTYATKIKKEIKKMGPTITAVFGTNYLDREQDFDFLDSMAFVFEKELPASKYSKQFVESIKSLRKIAIGKPAPNISLTSPDGKTISLESLKGKYVLIDFWASWCRPCREENPNVVKVYEKFKDKNFEIFAVSLDNDKYKWVEAIDHDHLTWPHVSELRGWESKVVGEYNISGIPASFLIDKDGKIIAKNLRGKDLEKKLEEVLL